jgi:hypothetical protein
MLGKCAYECIHVEPDFQFVIAKIKYRGNGFYLSVFFIVSVHDDIVVK